VCETAHEVAASVTQLAPVNNLCENAHEMAPSGSTSQCMCETAHIIAASVSARPYQIINKCMGEIARIVVACVW
jgi:hypothetical protein